MNLSEIQTFLTIVNTKSITRTADLLFLSQPTVSHRLSSLEEELGFPLIIRQKGHKQVELTPKGEDFVPIAERWISLWKDTQALQQNPDRMHLIIGCTDSLNLAVMAPLYRQILAGDYPLDLTVETHQSPELYDMLNNYDIDIGFVYHKLNYKQTYYEKLFEESLYLVQSENPAVPKPRIHTNEMDPSKEICLNWDDNFKLWHDRWLADPPWHSFTTDTISLLDRVWCFPDNWIIAPKSVVMELGRSRPLYVSEIVNQPPRRACYRIKRKYPKVTGEKTIKYFEEILDDYLKTPSPDIPTGRVWQMSGET